MTTKTENLADVAFNCKELSLMRKRSHHRLILPMIERLLKQTQLAKSELHNIICNIGPGSFVGLRIAVGVAQGISYANSLKVSGISALEVLAVQMLELWQKSVKNSNQQADGKIGIISICDAKPGDVYWAYYAYDMTKTIDTQEMPSNLCVTEVIPPSLSKIENISKQLQIPPEQPLLIVGGSQDNLNAVVSCFNNTTQVLSSQHSIQTSAKDLLKVAMTKLVNASLETIEPAKLTPLYLSPALSS